MYSMVFGATKLVYRISDKAILNLASTATETSYKLEMSLKYNIFPNMNDIDANHLLFEHPKDRFSRVQGPY